MVLRLAVAAAFKELPLCRLWCLRSRMRPFLCTLKRRTLLEVTEGEKRLTRFQRQEGGGQCSILAWSEIAHFRGVPTLSWF